jgi:hypothetical protein
MSRRSVGALVAVCVATLVVPTARAQELTLLDSRIRRQIAQEIWRFVAAEAREAGAHYYGTVQPADVLAYLENVVAAGLIRLN